MTSEAMVSLRDGNGQWHTLKGDVGLVAMRFPTGVTRFMLTVHDDPTQIYEVLAQVVGGYVSNAVDPEALLLRFCSDVLAYLEGGGVILGKEYLKND